MAIFADGTWASPERIRATNVLQMARAVKPEVDGIEQIAFYDWGVGTDRKRIGGGISGVGIDKNILDCYRFIVHNYDKGDQLFFFGFSRGAYTVRSLAGFIRNCGIVKREHAQMIPAAYKLYRKRAPASRPGEAEAVQFREDFAAETETEIEFVGAWDTVGSLGIPVPFWGTLNDDAFLFHDCEPSKIVRHARHAVSIDENREDFEPVLWSDKPDVDVKQVWFSGVHCDVGGGYKEHGLSDWASYWMLNEANKFGLVFESHFVGALAPNSGDRQHNELKGIYRMRNAIVREIDGPLHKSVKERWDLDAQKYRKKSKALNRFLQSPAVAGDWHNIELVE